MALSSVAIMKTIQLSYCFSSLVQTRDDGLGERPCVKIAELIICIASTMPTAM